MLGGGWHRIVNNFKVAHTFKLGSLAVYLQRNEADRVTDDCIPSTLEVKVRGVQVLRSSLAT